MTSGLAADAAAQERLGRFVAAAAGARRATIAAIAPLRGPAKALADFHAGVIAYATDYDDTGVPLPRCFKCKRGTVEITRALDDAIVWQCARCRAEGRISHWQGTFWDLSERPDASS